jgi:hypothetical protein
MVEKRGNSERGEGIVNDASAERLKKAREMLAALDTRYSELGMLSVDMSGKDAVTPLVTLQSIPPGLVAAYKRTHPKVA